MTKKERNEIIYELYRRHKSLRKVAGMFDLTHEAIRKICQKEAQLQGHTLSTVKLVDSKTAT